MSQQKQKKKIIFLLNEIISFVSVRRFRLRFLCFFFFLFFIFPIFFFSIFFFWGCGESVINEGLEEEVPFCWWRCQPVKLGLERWFFLLPFPPSPRPLHLPLFIYFFYYGCEKDTVVSSSIVCYTDELV